MFKNKLEQFVMVLKLTFSVPVAPQSPLTSSGS